MGKLDGKVAIVTGSGQGIGRGIAMGLAKEGAKVITNNRKKGTFSVAAYDKASMPEEDWNEMMALAGDAEATAELIKAAGGEAIPVYGDVSKMEDAQKMVDVALENWGRIDIIVNNAAGMGSGSIVNLDSANWEKLTKTKMEGAFNLMHCAVPHMIEQGFGRILNGSSDAWVGLPSSASPMPPRKNSIGSASRSMRIARRVHRPRMLWNTTRCSATSRKSPVRTPTRNSLLSSKPTMAIRST